MWNFKHIRLPLFHQKKTQHKNTPPYHNATPRLLPLPKEKPEGVLIAQRILPLPNGEPEGVLITQRVLPLSKGELEGVQS